MQHQILLTPGRIAGKRQSKKSLVVSLVLLLLFMTSLAGTGSVKAHSHSSYTDVVRNDTWGAAILFITDNGWAGGYSTAPPCITGTPCFLPNNGSTRGQVSKMVVNAKASEGVIPIDPLVPTFSDVPRSHEFYKVIETMYYYGWITGYSDPQCADRRRAAPCFLPDDQATRGQFSKMVVKAMNQVRPFINPPAPTFSDVAPGSTFYAYIETSWSHFLILDNGRPYNSTYKFRPGDPVVRGDVAMALYHATPHERSFVHNGLYSGSNNWDGADHNCNAIQTTGQSTFLPGVEVGHATDYGGYQKFQVIGRQIQFDYEAKNYLSCTFITHGWKPAIVFHAFDNPGGGGNCQNGVYSQNSQSNLPRPVRYLTQSACRFFVDHNELRIVTDSPSDIRYDSAEYFAQAEWRPSDSHLKGEINIDNYQLDASDNSMIGHKDNMQKFCYERGNNGTGYTGNRYGIFPCP